MSALVTPEAVRTSTEWPLTRPFMSFDAGMAPVPADLPVGILLADDDGWDWLQDHPDEVVEAACYLRDASAPADSQLWLIGSFRTADVGEIRLVTRGLAVDGKIKAAVLDIDPKG